MHIGLQSWVVETGRLVVVQGANKAQHWCRPKENEGSHVVTCVSGTCVMAAVLQKAPPHLARWHAVHVPLMYWHLACGRLLHSPSWKDSDAI
eukprot:362009-Chlamydomonas_euryale.AAC.10